MDLNERIRILTEGAKYDVSCSSSGAEQAPKKAAWATPLIAAFAIPSLRTADAFLC